MPSPPPLQLQSSLHAIGQVATGRTSLQEFQRASMIERHMSPNRYSQRDTVNNVRLCTRNKNRPDRDTLKHARAPRQIGLNQGEWWWIYLYSACGSVSREPVSAMSSRIARAALHFDIAVKLVCQQQ